MGHITFGILTVAAALIFGWAMFLLWVGVTVMRLLGRGVGMVLRGMGILPARIVTASRGMTARCTHMRCGAINPREARFCRRCGSPLVVAAKAQTRHPVAA